MPSVIHTKILRDINLHGRSVLMIACECGKRSCRLAFGYTIGNHILGYPELLFIGSGTTGTGYMMNAWSNLMIKRRSPFENGELVEIAGNKFPHMAIIATDPRTKEDFTVQASEFYGTDDYGVIQMVISDREKRFGTEAAEPYRNNPILGAR
jgi:hypothetical protein